MPKIAMIGAGSMVFCKTLVNDILATEALKDSEICLMSRTLPKLERMERFVQRMIDENNLPAKTWSTLDRRNDGYISNLPNGCCVEVPVTVNKQGLHPENVGDLPPQTIVNRFTQLAEQEVK